MEDEIDLDQYIKTVFKHWKLALGITLAAVITAGIISFSAPPVYEAKTLLLSSGESVNMVSDLAKSSETAMFMLEEISDRLTPGERSLSAIQNMFKIETSDTFITCTAHSADAQRSVSLANSWAEAFIKYATEVSLKSLPATADLHTQIESTYSFYQDAQSSYESFQRTSRMDEISRQIADADLLYQALQLRDSLDSSQGSSSQDEATSTAFMLIKLKSYTTIPAGSQIPIGSAAAVTKADIDDLVRQLEDRSGIHGKSANQVLQEKNTLTAQLEQEKHQSDELLVSRDAALNAYLAAVKNAQTTNIQRNSMIAPVRIVSYATTPQSPISSNRWTNIGIALVLGLILGVIAAFIADYIEKRRPAPPAKQPADSKPRQE